MSDVDWTLDRLGEEIDELRRENAQLKVLADRADDGPVTAPLARSATAPAAGKTAAGEAAAGETAAGERAQDPATGATLATAATGSAAESDRDRPVGNRHRASDRETVAEGAVHERTSGEGAAGDGTVGESTAGESSAGAGTGREDTAAGSTVHGEVTGAQPATGWESTSAATPSGDPARDRREHDERAYPDARPADEPQGQPLSSAGQAAGSEHGPYPADAAPRSGPRPPGGLTTSGSHPAGDGPDQNATAASADDARRVEPAGDHLRP